MILREKAERRLVDFVRVLWPVLEPASRKFIDGWPIDAICEHLEAVSYGEITHLLMNVPPGSMKSMLTDVFWPLWEWSALDRPWLRYLCASYSQGITIRDNQRFLNLIRSNEFQEMWGDRFSLTHDGAEKLQNDKTGWKLATSVGGIGTGERADRIIIDDPHSVKKAASDVEMASALQWFTEVIPSRTNDEMSAFIVIMQRVREDDISGKIISELYEDYTHLLIPMEFDTSYPQIPTKGVGWLDPRTQENELYWPERFSRHTVDRLKFVMGRYGTASQLQQRPAPKGGGIIMEESWQPWPKRGMDIEGALKFPDMDHIVVSVDTAMTEKEQNDESAITVWGTWREWATGAVLDRIREEGSPTGEVPSYALPRVMLVYSWNGRLEFHKLIDKIMEIAKKYHCDALLIEAKNNGFPVAQEIVRLNLDQPWVTHLYPVKGDKVARAYSVQGFFDMGMIYAPDRTWATRVIEQCAMFPKGKHDDLVDSVTQALIYLRGTGLLAMDDERTVDVAREMLFRGGQQRSVIPANYDI